MDKKSKRLLALSRQIDRLQQRLDLLAKTSERYSYLRLLTFLGGFIVNGIAFITVGPGWLWLTFLAAAVTFLSIVYIHNQIEEVIIRHTIWLETTKSQVARMRLEWQDITNSKFHPDNSLALDLDLIGTYSLHRLTDTAVSIQGSLRLKEWLTQTIPNPKTTVERQQRVKELVDRPLFRKKLVLNGIYASGEQESASPQRLLEWLQEQQLDPTLKSWVWGLAILALVNVLLFIAHQLGLLPPIWQGTLVIYILLTLNKSFRYSEPFSEASHLRDVLEQLLAVFHQLEKHSYQHTPGLALLCQPFLHSDQKPSHYLGRLNKIVNATGLRGNPLFALLLNALFPYDIFFAYKLQEAKQELVDKLPEWMDIWFELEALASLANLAYLNPHYTFPTFNQKGDTPLFISHQMGHPLLRDGQKISNDFTVNKTGSIAILTGSNMSGKSTFLRTIGINLILAFCGGPVDAADLQTAFFRLHTCIRISDSITSGISHFYAEVRCLKSLMNEAEEEHPLPLLYLIDEIFQGTNNRERLIGSRSFIRSMAKKECIGLISTHDLELAQLAEEIPGLINYHFNDSVSEGRLHFDYHIQPGPSPTTNALKIMAMEGLPVGDE